MEQGCDIGNNWKPPAFTLEPGQLKNQDLSLRIFLFPFFLAPVWIVAKGTGHWLDAGTTG